MSSVKNRRKKPHISKSVEYPHFRYLKQKEGPVKNKKRHPKIILERESDRYHYMGLTESAKRGHHNNLPLLKNPKKDDIRPAYVRLEFLTRPTKDFGDIEKEYLLINADKERVLHYANKLRKGSKNKKK